MIKLKKIRLILVCLCLWFIMVLPVHAEVNYQIDESPSFEKRITWSSSEGEAEFKYLSGEASADAFDSAISAGNGASASITVKENGVYTLFAKTSNNLQAVSVPVVTIDRTAPDITLIDVKRNSDGTVDVTYQASDYFGVADTRIGSGSLATSDFGGASAIGGGIIRGLSPGRYTIFAKDVAGNIATYSMSVEAQETTESYEYKESSEWSTEWSTEYGSNWLHYEYDMPTIVLISKQDMVTGEEVKGAHLEIRDESWNLIASFVTNGTQTQIKNVLLPGHTYTLIETLPPAYYEKAEDVTFTVKEDGSITQVVMYDKPIPREVEPEPSRETQSPLPKEKETQIKVFPQTGGFGESRALGVAGSVLLIIMGGVAIVCVDRRRRKDKDSKG